MWVAISLKWHIGLLFPILHSLSVKELFIHTFRHVTSQFYKNLTRKSQVYFLWTIDFGLLHAACFGQWNIRGWNRNRGFAVCLCFGLTSRTSAICHEKTMPGVAMAKENEKTYGVAWIQAMAWSQAQIISVGPSRSRGYTQCYKWEINAFYFKSLAFRQLA